MVQIDDAPLLLKPEQVAKKLNKSRTFVFGLIAARQLESLKLGKNRLIPTDAVIAYIEREREAQAGG